MMTNDKNIHNYNVPIAYNENCDYNVQKYML